MRKEFDYQKDGQYFAQCGRHIEELLAQELTELGAVSVETMRGGTMFEAEKEVLYRVTYCSKLATRILVPLITFHCASETDLYQAGYDFEWEKLFDVSHTFAIFSHVSHSSITHSQYAALKLKDAIVDRFRKRTGNRPSIDRENPDIWFHLDVQTNHASISLDASCGSLHRRGYRIHGGTTPLQETLAAAIVRLCAWDGERRLYDPMCGAGTLLAEALIHWCRIPSGYLRKHFGFEFLPDYDPRLWGKVKKSCDNLIRDVTEGLISGSDISIIAIKMAHDNLSRVPSGNKISLAQMDFREIPGLENSVIVSNLPYGVRQGKKEELEILYKNFGDFLKRKCKGATAFILCGNPDLIGSIGLKPSRRIPLFNGPIECRLLKFELY